MASRRNYYREPGLGGLINRTNMCYMNSAIQCLSNVPPLTDHFLQIDRHSSPLVLRFAGLLKKMWHDNPNATSARQLKDVVGYIDDRFRSDAQQDSYEFCLLLLQELHSALAESFHESIGKSAQSIVEELFHGQLKSTLRCECGYKMETDEMFSVLSLPIPKQQAGERFASTMPIKKKNVRKRKRQQKTAPGPVSLRHCFQEYLREDAFEGDEALYCNLCSKRTTHTKKYSFIKLPQFIIIHLKRFEQLKNNAVRKVEIPIIFQESLNFADILPEFEDCPYELVSIVNHCGSLNFGHYTATCHHRSGRWYEFNDLWVHPSSQEAIVSMRSSAFMLVYKQKEVVRSLAGELRKRGEEENTEATDAEQPTPAKRSNIEDIRSFAEEFPSSQSMEASVAARGLIKPESRQCSKVDVINISQPEHFKGKEDEKTGAGGCQQEIQPRSLPSIEHSSLSSVEDRRVEPMEQSNSSQSGQKLQSLMKSTLLGGILFWCLRVTVKCLSNIPLVGHFIETACSGQFSDGQLTKTSDAGNAVTNTRQFLSPASSPVDLLNQHRVDGESSNQICIELHPVSTAVENDGVEMLSQPNNRIGD